MKIKYCDWCKEQTAAPHPVLFPVMGRGLEKAVKIPEAKRLVFERHFYLCDTCWKKAADKITTAMISSHGGPMEE